MSKFVRVFYIYDQDCRILKFLDFPIIISFILMKYLIFHHFLYFQFICLVLLVSKKRWYFQYQSPLRFDMTTEIAQDRWYIPLCFL